MNVHMATSVPPFTGFLIASETIEHRINAGFHIPVVSPVYSNSITFNENMNERHVHSFIE